MWQNKIKSYDWASVEKASRDRFLSWGGHFGSLSLLLWELAWRRSLLVIYLFTDLFELNFMFHSLQHLTVVSVSFCKELLVSKDTAWWLSANSRLRREVQPIDGSWELSVFIYSVISFIEVLNKYGFKLGYTPAINLVCEVQLVTSFSSYFTKNSNSDIIFIRFQNVSAHPCHFRLKTWKFSINSRKLSGSPYGISKFDLFFPGILLYQNWFHCRNIVQRSLISNISFL